jgi:CDP-diacylglycerol--glycerol-3-phosphate 3-phosphatidyltransferase
MKRSTIKHLPNLVTLLRLFLCPTIIFLIVRGKNQLALFLFALACGCDYLDGFLARRLDAQTALGKVLDPVCDKVFVLAFFSLLMTLGECPPWFLGLLISVSLFQGFALLLLRISSSDLRLLSNTLPLGKWNMVVQFVWIGILLGDSLLFHRGEDLSSPTLWLHEVVYLCLGAAQVAVFLRYFFLYQPELAPHFRPLTRPA